MATTKHTYLKTHQLSGDVLSFVLPAEEAALRERAAAAKAGRAAKTLVKEGALRLTLVALNKGVALQAHQVDGALSIHVLRGRVRISAAGEDVTGAPGAVVVLAPQQTHAAVAVSDCALLVTVAAP